MDALKAREKLAAAEETSATSTNAVADKVSEIQRFPTNFRATEWDRSGLLEETVLVGLAYEIENLTLADLQS